MSDRPHSYAEEYGDPLGPARKPTASFERKRELWQRQIVADKDLLPTHRIVGIAISWHFNRQNGIGWPGIRKLMKLTNFAKQTVVRAIDALHTRGHVEITRTKSGNRHNANRYTLLIKSETRAEINGSVGRPRVLPQSTPRVLSQSRTHVLPQSRTEPPIEPTNKPPNEPPKPYPSDKAAAGASAAPKGFDQDATGVSLK